MTATSAEKGAWSGLFFNVIPTEEIIQFSGVGQFVSDRVFGSKEFLFHVSSSCSSLKQFILRLHFYKGSFQGGRWRHWTRSIAIPEALGFKVWIISI